MTVKEMNQKIDTAVTSVNRFLVTKKQTSTEEMLEALRYNVVAEEVAKQIEFLREQRRTKLPPKIEHVNGKIVAIW